MRKVSRSVERIPCPSFGIVCPELVRVTGCFPAGRDRERAYPRCPSLGWTGKVQAFATLSARSSSRLGAIVAERPRLTKLGTRLRISGDSEIRRAASDRARTEKVLGHRSQSTVARTVERPGLFAEPPRAPHPGTGGGPPASITGWAAGRRGPLGFNPGGPLSSHYAKRIRPRNGSRIKRVATRADHSSISVTRPIRLHAPTPESIAHAAPGAVRVAGSVARRVKRSGIRRVARPLPPHAPRFCALTAESAAARLHFRRTRRGFCARNRYRGAGESLVTFDATVTVDSARKHHQDNSGPSESP
jgi:hypothetical protein